MNLPFLLLFGLHLSQALVAYKSLEPINATQPFAGLKLDRNSVLKNTSFNQGLSFCARFNYRKLGWDSYMFTSLTPHHFARLSMGDSDTFLFFGNMNWIVKELQTNKFQIWSTNKWHHVCLSFDRTQFHLKFFKVKSLVYNCMIEIGEPVRKRSTKFKAAN